jgi:peptidoglycan/LPS O-acetylase OafA/YrhL
MYGAIDAVGAGQMLGGFRFTLAAAVVIYHMGVQPLGLHIGITAVAAFYMVSGYAMSAMWQRWYAADNRVVAFYFDRILRLYPQYIAFCVVSGLVIVGLGWRLDLFQIRSPGWVTVIAHLTMVPLSCASICTEIGQSILIPQSWSLGTELLFYLIFPALQSRRATAAALIVSLAIFATAAVGKINPDALTFRLLPGCLFFFLIGVLMQRGDRELLWLTGWVLVIVAAGLALLGKLSFWFNRELLGSIVIATFAISSLTRYISGPIDTLLGDLSYGVYLSHMIVIVIVAHLGWFADDFAARCCVVVGGSVAAAFAALALVERPAASFRKSLRCTGGRLKSESPAQPFARVH